MLPDVAIDVVSSPFSLCLHALVSTNHRIKTAGSRGSGKSCFARQVRGDSHSRWTRLQTIGHIQHRMAEKGQSTFTCGHGFKQEVRLTVEVLELVAVVWLGLAVPDGRTPLNSM